MEEEATDKTDQDRQGSEVTENEAGGDESGPPEDPASEGESSPPEDPASEGESSPAEDLKVVVSIRGGNTTTGVQRPSADPHIESFDETEPSGLGREVTAVIERARAKWEESPRYPAYTRPTRSTRRRPRGGQGSAQDTTAEALALEGEREKDIVTVIAFDRPAAGASGRPWSSSTPRRSTRRKERPCSKGFRRAPAT